MSNGADWSRDTVLVGGRWHAVPGTCAVYDPATEEQVGAAADAQPADVDGAVEAARQAGANWARTTQEERSDALTALHHRLAARRDALVDATVAEVGAPVRQARADHVDMALDVLASYARITGDFPFSERVANSLVLREPAGVVGCITPWNYPLYQLVAKVAAALGAGCTVVAKPAELTPITAYLFADAVLAAGLPHGVFNLVPGRGSVVGEAIASHPGVDVVSFTGSTAVGMRVAAQAAASVKRVCLELGGKSASMVLPDADLEAAVTATVGSATVNTGQACSALTRLLVPWPKYHDAVELAAKRADALVVGDPTDERTDLGPLISAQQRTAVLGYVERAAAAGALIAAGGTDRPPALTRGHYVQPTVLADVTPDDEVAQQEVFGPVLCVLGYKDEDEAVAIANGTQYGLAGAVWSASSDAALAVARRLRAGQVDINGARFNVEAPFGGYKQSGVGRELGRAGLEEFCELKAVQL